MPTGWILRELNPAELKNHPVNIEIYGTQSPDDEMLASVKEFGVLDPLKATKDSVVLSGMRRLQHAKIAKLKAVPVLVSRTALSDYEQVVEIVESNRCREKTMEQKAREYAKLSEAKAAEARKRMVSGKKSDPGKKVSEGENGRAKDDAASHVGMSRPTAEKAREVVEEIDKAKEAGDESRAASLRQKLNKGSVSEAHREARPDKAKSKANGAVDIALAEPDSGPADKGGNALPDRPELVKAFKSRDLFHSCEAARNVIYNNCYEIAKLIPDGEQFKNAIDKHMKALFHTMGQYEPAYVCKSCSGGRCVKCAKRGYTCCK